MNSKKLAIIGAVVLVIIGSVIAAGCTTTQTTNTGTAVSSSNLTNQIAGAWQTQYLDGGVKFYGVMLINTDGTAHWYSHRKTLDLPDSLVFNETWEKIGDHKFGIKNLNTGTTYQYEYNPVTDTIQEISDDPVGIFSRIDPIVGIWAGPAKSTDGIATSVILTTGGGFSFGVYNDGTVDITGLTWKKNEDGTYAIAYNNGDTRTYTLSQDKKTLTTDDGRTKKRYFDETPSIAGVIGAWYNKDKNEAILLNGNGTGVFKGKDSISKFNWKMNDIGKFTFTTTDGKEYQITFDFATNTFTNSDGIKFIRPTETMESR